MATAKHIPAVKELKEVVVSPEKIQLELSLEEAEILRLITGQILTPPGNELRSNVEGIWMTLKDYVNTPVSLKFKGEISYQHNW